MFVLSLARPDGNARTWWRTRIDGTALTDNNLEALQNAAAPSETLDPGLLAPNWLRVCVSRRSKVAPCCALDEGRPLGAALQEEASNRHERLLFNGNGRERHG